MSLEKKVKKELSDLASLRKKVDYDPSSDISPKEVIDAIEHMENIFNQLEFEYTFFLKNFQDYEMIIILT